MSVDTGEVAIAHVGPDPRGRGGMAAVMRDLLASPPPGPWRLEVIVTWRGFRPWERARVFAAALVRLTVWCLRPGRRIVHIHGTARGSLYRKSACLLVAWVCRCPAVIQIHSGPPDIERFDRGIGAVRRFAFGLALGTARRRLAVSSGSAATMSRIFGPTFEVMPNLAPRVPEAEIIGGPGGGDAGVLYVGGFENPVKGGEMLIDVVERLAPELPKVRFALAGPGEPPPRLTELAARLPNVSWLGWLDDGAKRAAMVSHPIFVLPSHSEGLPVALLEAMSWGRAIVATAVGGVTDVVKPGRDAVVVDPADAAALADALRSLAEDEAERRRLGAAAREAAVALNDEVVGARLGGIYSEMLA
jgi:glycosyltransferase involved in cell wall biosynthesis